MHTITGSESSSASANAWTWRSTASWFDSAKSWIQPQSRCDITSEWSFQMLIGRPDRPVRDRHHDRQAEAGGVVERLGHVEQALARGRGVRARACGGRSDRGRQRRELGLDHQVLARGELAGPDVVRERLDDVRLRRDRVRGDDLGPAERHRSAPRPGSPRSGYAWLVSALRRRRAHTPVPRLPHSARRSAPGSGRRSRRRRTSSRPRA